MAVGDRFKKFDLEKLRTYEKYDNEGTLKISTKALIPEAVKHINDSVEEKLKSIVTEKVESIPVWFEYETTKQKELIENLFETRLKEEFKLEDISDIEKENLINKITSHVSGFGILQTFLEQSNVEGIVVNSTNSVMIQVGGKILDTEMSLDNKQLDFLKKSIISKSNGKLPSPVGSVRFENYSITAIDKPVSSEGTIIKIKKIKKVAGINDLILTKFLTKEVSDFIISLIQSKEKIIISGDIMSGKTYLIDNILTSSLTGSRIAVIEDYPQISTNRSKYMKFSIGQYEKNGETEKLLSLIFGLLPDYIVFDSKNLSKISALLENLPENVPAIMTVPAGSPESALNKLISNLSGYSHISEKTAKQKVLNSFHYIIQLEKDKNGNCKIGSINEINLTRNSAQILKELYKADNSLNSSYDELPDEIKSASVKSRFNFV